jgi:hypothetical protein
MAAARIPNPTEEIHVTAIRSFSLVPALVAALALPACAPADDMELAEESAALSRPSQMTLANMQIVGSLQYGQTSSVVNYKNPKMFRAFKFAGGAGDQVVVDVRSTNGGDAIAWVLDDSFEVIAMNDDKSSRTVDSHIEITLPAHESRTHYIVFRDYGFKAKKFKVELQGTVAPPSTDAIYACNVDADCEKVTAGCCRNSSWTAIAKGQDDAYMASLNCREDLMCTRQMPRDTNDVAQCNSDNKCELVDPLQISCMGHRINMHTCPDGFKCAGEGIAYDVPGVCRKPCGGMMPGSPTCSEGEACIDDPTDDCTAGPAADCPGICQPKTCGGFGGLSCQDGMVCVDDPNDDCDVATGGADCSSICAEY